MELSNSDKEYINKQSRDNPVHTYFDHVKPYDFKVGDYLIRKIRDMDMQGKLSSDWRTVKVHPRSPINKKFVVVHVDEYGVPYVKHVKVDGKLGGILCLASNNFQMSRFEPDPEQMEHIILDNQDEFDPLASHKERKK